MKAILKFAFCAGFLLVLLPAVAQHRSIPIPFNDTLEITPGIPVTIDLYANDSIPAGDSLRLIITGNSPPKIEKGIGGNVTFTLIRWGYMNDIVLMYRILDVTQGVLSDTAWIHMIVHDHSCAYLDVNNVKALFSASGLHFFLENSEYEVPKGSGKTTLFSNSAWIGGLDGSGQLHLAAERYRQGASGAAGMKHDYWAGPVSDSTAYNAIQDTMWNRVWKLNRTDIEFHRNNYWKPGYQIIRDILEWPVSGDPTLGQSAQLAPYRDENLNGYYDPMNGDYPEIIGDQALFFIYNDDHGFHAETTGEKLRVEVHGMAYAFDRPNDTAFKNTIFLKLKFINRSANSYYQTWLGTFADVDLGYANDDYIGCDPERGMFYTYNGPPVDGTGQSNAYGANPPSQAVVMLAGPMIGTDGYDNPSFKGSSLLGPSFNGNCDIVTQDSTVITMNYGPGAIYSAPFLVRSDAINGTGFADGIVDNERMGMKRFIYTNNSVSGVAPYMTDPVYAPDYYQTLRGLWRDNSKMIYGGNGHLSTGGYGPECNFMFPGLSDQCNWGTLGMLPNGPKEWTEKTAKNNPQDRRGIISSGYFIFPPGDVQEMELAFVWARNYTAGDTTRSIPKLETAVDSVRSAYLNNRVPDGGTFSGIPATQGTDRIKLKISPNPASDMVNIGCPGLPQSRCTVEVYSGEGQRIRFFPSCNSESFRIHVADLLQGIYFVRVVAGTHVMTGKLLIVR